MKTTKERLAAAIQTPLKDSLAFYHTSLKGLDQEQVEENRDLYGENTITKGQEDSIFKKIYESIINPFTIIFERLVVALSLRNSRTKRIPPEIKTKTTIMIEVVGSSWPGLASQTFVTRDIKAITSKMIVKGLIMDS